MLQKEIIKNGDLADHFSCH